VLSPSLVSNFSDGQPAAVKANHTYSELHLLTPGQEATMQICAATLCSLFLSSLLTSPGSAQQGNVSPGQPVNVLTYHFDNMRTGLNRQETTLTPANVNSAGFGKVNFLATDGKVDGQPLYASNVLINGQSHNVTYAVSEHDSIYAFDADNGTQLWKVTALQQGESPSGNHGCGQITPEIGITNTPVIDRTKQPNGALYLVAMAKDANNNYHQRLHALDLSTGSELFGGPVEIQAKYPGTGDNSQNGFVVFDPGQYAERSGLLEISGNIYLAFTSHCDQRPYTGWVMQYSASTLAQLSVLNVTPNGNEGAIWQGGGGMAADNDGNIYFLDGNGTFDTTLDANGFPIKGDFGNAFIKVSSANPMKVLDYFATYNTVQQSDNDIDLGSGGALVIPNIPGFGTQQIHLVIGAGKDSNIYVANRDKMGKWNPNNNDNLYQVVTNALPNGSWSMPAFYHNNVYFGGVADHLKAYPIVLGKLATKPGTQTATSFPYPGATPSVSANLESNAILWAVENSTPAVLHAYNALDLTKELYNSNQQGARDQFGPGNKFITPMIANGRVYVGTQTGVAVFGLLQ
jgi:outer membrane protein assembly factor BamB